MQNLLWYFISDLATSRLTFDQLQKDSSTHFVMTMILSFQLLCCLKPGNDIRYLRSAECTTGFESKIFDSKQNSLGLSPKNVGCA